MNWLMTAEELRGSLLSHLAADVKKAFNQLMPGDTFSVNEKSKPMVLVHVDEPTDKLVVRESLPGGQRGNEISLPLSDYVGREVVLHKEAAEEEASREFKEGDRVKLRSTNVEGTLAVIQKSKPGDIDFIILWDSPDQRTNYENMTEVHPPEIEYIGKSTDEQETAAKEAKAFYKNADAKREKEFVDKISDKVVEKISSKASLELVSTELNKQADAIEKVAIEQNSSEFNAITRAATLSITAGEYNGDIEHLEQLMDDYSFSILNKVCSVTKSYDLQPVVASRIMNRIAQSVLDGYWLTRQAYIKKIDGKWGVYSKKGKRLGLHPTKEKALRQLRAVERNKHMRGE